MGSRRTPLQWLPLAAAAAGALAASGAAWACVPFPLVTVEPRASGPEGATVTVEGTDFGAAGTVEVRWGAADGPKLATAAAPSFSAEVTVPPSPAGLYSVVVVTRGPDGALGPFKASTVFQVVDPGSVVAPAGGTIPTRRRRIAPAAAPDAGIPTGPAVAGGAGLLVIGAAGGSALARRRYVVGRRPSPDTD